MAKYAIDGATLVAIGDAIRAKTGGTQGMTPSEMEDALNSIPNKSSADLTVSGSTVTVPAGNYKSAASKSVATATQATPSISVSSGGLITASATQSAGYVASGTKSATKQLTVQAAKTVTPSTSEQTAVASGVYTTGVIKVGAMPTATQATPSISVSSGGLITASATQSAGYVASGTKSATKQLTVQAAKTVTPSTSSQTAVNSGVYTTGAITVAAIPSSYKQLNFTIVGGTTKPSSPSNNTIWVKTSTSITRWIIGLTAPTSPVAGMVWVCVDTHGSAVNSFVTVDNIVLNVTKVYQYTNSQWVAVEAHLYQSSAWTQLLHRTYLFDNGTDNTALTGGWQVYNATGSGGGGSASIGSEYLYVGYHGSNSRDSSIFTKNLINVAEYKKLCAYVKITSVSNWFAVGLANSRAADASTGCFTHYKTSNVTGSYLTLEVDISSATSTYYVGVYGNVANAYVYAVWFE